MCVEMEVPLLSQIPLEPKRLGCRNDAEDIMQHTFFDCVDWELVAARATKTPFRPSTKQNVFDQIYGVPEPSEIKEPLKNI
jgi:hypothetical protein